MSPAGSSGFSRIDKALVAVCPGLQQGGGGLPRGGGWVGWGGEEKEQLPTSVPDGSRGAVANTKRLTKRRPHGLQLRGETGLGG